MYLATITKFLKIILAHFAIIDSQTPCYVKESGNFGS